MKVILVGFMGTGKTTVGERLASRLGVPFLDIDTLIEGAAGRSVPEIFEAEGEEGFRRWERWAVARVAPLEELVVGTGGGTWVDPDNRRLLERGARVVCLRASPGEIRRRVEEGGRPLLADDRGEERLEELLAAREEAYASAPEQLDTTGLDPDEVVNRILHGHCTAAPESAEAARITVSTAEPYDIVSGSELLDSLPGFLEEAGITGGRIGVVSDAVVAAMHGGRVRRSLEDAGWEVLTHVFPPGESSKGPVELARIYDSFLAAGIDRDFPLLALGGGVTGDLAGFAAATLLRGIPLVQVPTTLLSQVDSSVGGKVAINHPTGKNLIGAFHQPRLVVCDVGFLGTLSDAQYASGMGEVLKHGLISGGPYLHLLSDGREDLGRREPRVLREVVRGSCRIKADFVAGDERDRSRRMLLNFGHTTAHAVETVSRGEVAHGIAVGYGMAVAARISREMGYLPRGDCAFVLDLLARWEFPVSCGQLPPGCEPDVVMDAMASDKKRRRGELRWILLGGVGEPFVADDVPREAVISALKGGTL